MKVNKKEKLITFGLDIGIASVGWSVLSPSKIIASGAHTFNASETPKEGRVRNQERRAARLARNRLKHRSTRLRDLKRILKEHGAIESPKDLNQPNPDLWQVRVDGLKRKLAPIEWAQVIYYCCKHRGFYWESKAEENEGDDKGKVKQGLSATKSLMVAKNYETVAQMMVSEYQGRYRNKDDYKKSIHRSLIADELTILFAKQRELGNPYAAEELENLILHKGNDIATSGILWKQKGALSPEDMMAMIGHCTFEQNEFRAPKESYTSERFILLNKLANMVLSFDDEKPRRLTESESRVAIELAYKDRSKSTVTYKQLKAALYKSGLIDKNRGFKFNLVRYKNDVGASEHSETFVNMRGLHKLKDTLTQRGQAAFFEKLVRQAHTAVPDEDVLLDKIAWVLAVYKTDKDAAVQLENIGLSPEEIEPLLYIRFDDFGRLSTKAMRNIARHLESGLKYHEAAAEAGYEHNMFEANHRSEKKAFLPPLYKKKDPLSQTMVLTDDDAPRNPVVLRALNRAIRIINAMIKQYGSPDAIHIELTRDLSKTHQERNEIERNQKKNKKAHDEVWETFGKELGKAALLNTKRGRLFDKWKLYKEQNGRCAYTQDELDIHALQSGAYEIDHVLPRSRSADDSFANKVLVKTKENFNKGNMTAYEYLGGSINSHKWQRYELWVKNNKNYSYSKKEKLLKKEIPEGFKTRNLNDTRYISRYLTGYINKHLSFNGNDKQSCVAVKGGATASLRRSWGLPKSRDENDRHHAVDAIIVAACSSGMMQRISAFHKRKEIESLKGVVDIETGEIINESLLNTLEGRFPVPFANFRDVVNIIVFEPKDMTKLSRYGYNDEEISKLKPMFISRLPVKKITGKLHNDSIYGFRKDEETGEIIARTRVDIRGLKPTDIDKLEHPHRNKVLYDTITQWMKDNPTTYQKDAPLPRMPSKHGNGHVIRKVTKVLGKKTGVLVRGGIAAKAGDSTCRADLFQHKKTGEYFIVPIYITDVRKKELPNIAATKSKEVMDENYIFLFSIFKDTLIKIERKNKDVIFGYYNKLDISGGCIEIRFHDRGSYTIDGKPYKGTKRGIPLKTALNITKYHVDILGGIYTAPVEFRRGLA